MEGTVFHLRKRDQPQGKWLDQNITVSQAENVNVPVPFLTTRLCTIHIACTVSVHECAEKANRIR